MTKNIKAYIFFGSLLMIACATGCKKDSGGNGHDAGAPIVINEFTPARGGWGTEVLFTGTNYINDTNQITVTLNGKPLKVVGVNGGQVMAVVPKKAGSGRFVIRIGDDSVVSSGIFNYVYKRTVSTLAGDSAGFANGKGTDALFNFNGEAWYRSMGITVDDNLNLYVADPGNHCIRKIDSSGNVTTFCGNPGSSGYADGKGTAARFSLPYDVALDAAGNVWCVDPGNWDIRKIAPDGTATTWAWGRQAPWSVSVDKTSGIVYYSSCDPAGNVYPVTAQWTTGAPVVSGLNYPAGIRFDKTGNLYVVLNGDQVIKKYSAGSWVATTVAGQPGIAGYGNGDPAVAKFDHPWGLAVDGSGNLYVAGNGTWDGSTKNTDQAIRYIEAGTFNVSTYAGSGTAGSADAAGEAAAFSAPTGVAVDKNGTVYVLDKNNNRIRKIISD